MAALPSKCRRYLNERGIAFNEVVEGGQTGVILRGARLPDGRFDVPAADLLILLPAGYPDVAPDMFYALPWLSLVAARRYPTTADQPFPFEGKIWQRWSRHNDAWRPGVDGIWTMLKRIETALAVAA